VIEPDLPLLATDELLRSLVDEVVEIRIREHAGVVGLARATEMLMLGDRISAEDALRVGLVNTIVAPDALMDAARALAGRLTQGPSFALGMTKTLLNQELDIDFAAAIEAEAQGQAICMQTPSFRDAYEAFKARQRDRAGS
jgi:enoyl-CoA hydratase/carnithine racemase